MKHREKMLKQCLLAVVITIGLLSAEGFAQHSGLGEVGFSRTKSKEKELSLDEKVSKYKVNVDVVEPTKISEFLELIHEQTPTRLNILVSRNAKSVLIPQLKLTNVSVEAVLSAIVMATENEITSNFDTDEVIVISRDDGYYDDSRETVTVVNASDILENTEEASLLSAIEIGLEMRDSSKKNVTIQLHKETRLLFVKGVAADMNIVMQVVSELGGKPWPPQGAGGGGLGGGGNGLGGSLLENGLGGGGLGGAGGGGGGGVF